MSAKCPVSGCATAIQRTPEGTLHDGVIAHLKSVHDITGLLAETMASRAVRSPG